MKNISQNIIKVNFNQGIPYSYADCPLLKFFVPKRMEFDGDHRYYMIYVVFEIELETGKSVAKYGLYDLVLDKAYSVNDEKSLEVCKNFPSLSELKIKSSGKMVNIHERNYELMEEMADIIHFVAEVGSIFDEKLDKYKSYLKEIKEITKGSLDSVIDYFYELMD